jgi:hypothetical protein
MSHCSITSNIFDCTTGSQFGGAVSLASQNDGRCIVSQFGALCANVTRGDVIGERALVANFQTREDASRGIPPSLLSHLLHAERRKVGQEPE